MASSRQGLPQKNGDVGSGAVRLLPDTLSRDHQQPPPTSVKEWIPKVVSTPLGVAHAGGVMT